MEFEVGDVTLCTVEKIIGTTVFLHIEQTGQQGSMNFSEVAPGRIRNIRDYVVPKKTIVCKILKISNNNIELSLRRVTQKEQKEVREQYKQERNYKSILKSVLKEKTEEVIKKIIGEDSIFDFLENSKENPIKLEKIIGKENSTKVLEILNSQKKKKAVIKKKIELSTTASDGLDKIKELLGEIKKAEVKYISAGKYSLKIEGENAKKTDTEMKKIIESLQKKAKEKNIEFLSK